MGVVCCLADRPWLAGRADRCHCGFPEAVAKLKSKLVAEGVSFSNSRCVFCFGGSFTHTYKDASCRVCVLHHIVPEDAAKCPLIHWWQTNRERMLRAGTQRARIEVVPQERA